MTRLHQANTTHLLMAIIAVLLLVNLMVLLSRGSGSLLPEAWAQRQPPIAGGAGIFVMPAQLQSNVWGCYLLDVDSGTLCVYQWFPGKKQLEFVAARDYKSDRKLMDYNTFPSPQVIKRLVEQQNNPPRGVVPPTTLPGGATETQPPGEGD